MVTAQHNVFKMTFLSEIAEILSYFELKNFTGGKCVLRVTYSFFGTTPTVLALKIPAFSKYFEFSAKHICSKFTTKGTLI